MVKITFLPADEANFQAAPLLIWMMKLSGIWNFRDKWWNRLYQTYGWLLHLNFTFLFVLSMYIQVGMSKNLDELSQNLYMSLTETALLAKIITAFRHRDQFVDAMQTFDTYTPGQTGNDDETRIAVTAQRNFARLRNMHMGGTVVVIITGCISSLFDGSYKLPFPCWVPFDYHNDQNFYYAYMFVVVGILVTAGANLTMDLVQTYLMFHLAQYYKLLCYRWESSKWLVAERKESDRQITGRRMRELYQFHQYIVRMFLRNERLMSFPIFVQILISAFVICFTVYNLQNYNIFTEPDGFLMYFVFMLVMFLQIYLPCSYGHDLTASSQGVMQAVYSSNWYEAPVWVRKDLFVYMEWLKRPVVWRAGAIFNIDLVIFTQTLTNAYRIYALLLNIKN